jgi:serine/threonine-protein kinase
MKKIGKYIIRGLLGRGGMSRVYKVELPPIAKISALKRLEPTALLEKLMGRESLKKRFVAEATTIASIRHPHIVEIQDFDESAGLPFYVMEYYANNLAQMIGETYITETASRIIPIDKAIDYTRQILSGLACLHHFGIIHRDVKPFNVLITDRDRVKLCDFGLSKQRGETFGGPSNLNVGSPYYAAPEQEKNPDRVDFSADLYAVGIMLYRMLCGLLPKGPGTAAGFHAISALNPDLDSAWDEFIARATAKRPKDRFATARQMMERLETLACAWEEKKTHLCTLPEDQRPDSEKRPTKIRLRRQAIKVNPAQAPRHFAIDALWRPRQRIANDFCMLSAGIIEDHATGLIWQQSGSAYPQNWHQARDYVADLNQRRFGQLGNWRLPTIDELMSLLTRVAHGRDICIASLFDPTQKWLWSSDRRSYTAAWYVSVDLGFVACQDVSAYYYVRAVCDQPNQFP